jgi:hypothetical protein
MVLLSSMQRASLKSRHLCHRCNNVVALVAMMLSPSSSWCCCPCHDGVVAIVNVQVSLPLSGWCHHPLALAPLPTLHRHCDPCFTRIVAPNVQTFSSLHCMGTITIIAAALLSPSSWHVCPVALVYLPLSRWSCCPWCTGISALITQALLPLLCFRHAVNLQASLPSLSWHVLSRG